ncbi:MAG: RING finger domain-containing protein [Candidatus Hodarchaeales archaeon]
MEKILVYFQLYELIILATLSNFLFLLSFIAQILEKQVKKRAFRTCGICRKRIFSENRLIICPFCTSSFHRNHLNKWLVIKNKCPVCRKSFQWFNVNYDSNSSNRITNSTRLSEPQTTTSYPRRNYLFQDHQPRIHHNQGGTRNFSIECMICGDIWYKLTSYIPKHCRNCGLSFRNANDSNFILRKYDRIIGLSLVQRFKNWILHLLTWIKKKTPSVDECLTISNQPSHYTCSRCNNEIFEEYQFCYNCGEIVRR